MVPTLTIGRERLLKNGFMNGYFKDADKEVHYENCVYLLFNPKDVDRFKIFLDEEYERTKAIIDDYDYAGGYVVLVYELNKQFQKDFELVKQGKYSETSKEFQSVFPKTVKIKKNGLLKEQHTLQYMIFNKADKLKEYWEEKLGVVFDGSFEYWQGWIEENEVLFINKLEKKTEENV
jgi:hypothetical protein